MMARSRLLVGWLMLVGVAVSACYVPPDDGIADGGSEDESSDQQEEAEADQGQESDSQSPWWSTDPVAQQQPQEPGGSPDTEAEDEGAAEEKGRVARLAEQAREAYEEGNLSQAAEEYERALEGAPQRGVLWQNLAAVRLEQQRYRQAEELALRAIDRGEDIDVLRESWWLIAAARMERGDKRGARDAEQAAQSLGAAVGGKAGGGADVGGANGGNESEGQAGGLGGLEGAGSLDGR